MVEYFNHIITILVPEFIKLQRIYSIILSLLSSLTSFSEQFYGNTNIHHKCQFVIIVMSNVESCFSNQFLLTDFNISDANYPLRN